MLQQVLAAVLPLILWGAVSGVLNLMLTRKSQIEAWVAVHPTLAAWSKFLRSVGFDPWALHAWATLLVKKKLPEAQQANSPIAKLEQRKADLKSLGGGPKDPPGGASGSSGVIPPLPPPPSIRSFDPSDVECSAWDRLTRGILARALVLVVVAIVALACTRDVQPCSTEDFATGSLALHNASCAADRQARFPNFPDDKCDATPGCKAIVDKCDRWVEERCK